MRISKELPASLLERETFSRKEYVAAMSAGYEMTAPQISYDLQKRLDSGEIVRAGWSQYTFPRKRRYQHQYSDAANEVVEKIIQSYTDLSFQVFELIQLNDFMNHQVAHNTIFVTIENELVNFVFDSLWDAYPGRVMLKPSPDQYYRYRQDDEIIIGRLPSESPKGYDEPWKSRLEKILVDVFTDKLVSEIVPDGEKTAIITNAFDDFLLDENTMIRYARRKGVEKKMFDVLMEYGKVEAT